MSKSETKLETKSETRLETRLETSVESESKSKSKSLVSTLKFAESKSLKVKPIKLKRKKHEFTPLYLELRELVEQEDDITIDQSVICATINNIERRNVILLKLLYVTIIEHNLYETGKMEEKPYGVSFIDNYLKINVDLLPSFLLHILGKFIEKFSNDDFSDK